MNWRHVQLIFQREMSDQLRDRRTLFTITVLPILLYPFLGMLMMQVAQFKSDSTVRLQVYGLEEYWPETLPLLDEQGKLVPRSGIERVAKLVEFETKTWSAASASTESSARDAAIAGSERALSKVEEQAKATIALDQADLVLIVEPSFQDRLAERLEAEHVLRIPSDGAQKASAEELPNRRGEVQRELTSDGLRIVGNLARDRSQIARRRLDEILESWQQEWATSYLERAGVNPSLFEPLQLRAVDTAPASAKRAMLWSKVLPFVMLIWALTGAFYPAIDLCAGEKERGTLETLLSSPARRREIVWGKLGAICVFSIGSALLNLMSMHLTAGMIVKQLATQGTPQLAEALGPMPFHALGWLVLLLLPMAAFFSALALAVAALARSTKEGQYYLMPLLLVTLPLVALPLMPSLELNLGTSLVPVSGAVFLVRSLIEGRYVEAVVHLPMVLLVTAVCCWFSIRWAIRQFESESVMFRESGRWNLRIWIHHLWRDREDTASPTEAILCGVIIIVAMFFAQFLAGSSIDTWAAIAKSTVTVQVGLILTPCLLMSIFLTRSMRNALRIHRPQGSHLLAAVLLGICMHPSYMLLTNGIQQIYQIGEETQLVLQYFQGIVTAQPLCSPAFWIRFAQRKRHCAGHAGIGRTTSRSTCLGQ